MPVSSCRSPAGVPRLCCRLLRCDGAGGSSRGAYGVVLRGVPHLKAPNRSVGTGFGLRSLSPRLILCLPRLYNILCLPRLILRLPRDVFYVSLDLFYV